jgi:hypothetical protein
MKSSKIRKDDRLLLLCGAKMTSWQGGRQTAVAQKKQWKGLWMHWMGGT